MKRRNSGFTLIELLISVAIIGVLGAVGTPMYQGYLTSTKENIAKDNLQTIQFLQSEQYSDSGQYFPCPKKKTGTSQIDQQFFDGNGDLSSGDYEYEIRGGCTGFIAYAFRAALDAKCFSIDPSKQLKDVSCPKMLSPTSPKASPTARKSSAGYKPPAIAGARNGSWLIIDSNGKQVKGTGGMVCSLSFCGPGGGIYKWGGAGFSGNPPWGKGTLSANGYKAVFEQPGNPKTGNVVSRAGSGGMTYNFSTNIWTTASGQRYDTNGNRVK